MNRFALALAVALAVGQGAPDFKLLDQNGKAVSLSAARGHKVVLVFYRGYW
jgi:peroxiredoxin